MSVDCSDWVWTRSASKGTARTVLLAIADKCRDERCVAYAGTTMLMQRTNAARSSVIKAVDRLLASGELTIVKGSRGPRGETYYKLPHAVGHVRADPHTDSQGGSEAGPVQNPDRSENATPGTESGPPGSENTTPQGVRNPYPGGPEIGPGGYENETPGGPKTRPHNSSSLLLEEQQPHAPARTSRSPVTEQLRPLVEALNAAGVEVRWTLGLREQRDAYRLVERHGVERLVELAARRTAPDDPAKSARYWLKVWGDLDNAPPALPAGSAAGAGAGGNVVPLRGGRPAPISSADALLAGLALLEQEENA